MTDSPRLAVLIDADNTSPKLVKEMLDELASYGTLTVKRAYGDWTTQQLAGWKDHLLASAISPMQQFAFTRGKNSTDSAMVIDAMDLLYARNLEGFVIVSSDADFTRLATRLRESGMTVFGVGQRKTPKPFVEACDKFIYLEVIGSGGEQEPEPEKASQDGEKDQKHALQGLMTRAVRKSPQDDEDWTQLGTLGNLLNRTDPSFDPRSYGAAKLSDLVRSLPYLETRSEPGPGGRTEMWVRVKGSKPAQKNAGQKPATKGTTRKSATAKKTSGKPT